MSKRKKQGKQQPAPRAAEQRESNHSVAIVAHPPAKRPTLLAISIFLFAAWFLLLLVMALLA